MKILHLPESYLPDYKGGKEFYTHTLSLELQKLGVQVKIAIHGNSDFSHSYNFEGVEVRVLPKLVHKTPYSNRYSRTVDELPGFEDLLNSFKPDIVHFHDQNNGASLSHLELVKRKRIKTVVTFHTPGQVCPQRTLLYKGKEQCDGKLIPNKCTSCQLQSFWNFPSFFSNIFASIGTLKTKEPSSRFSKLLAHKTMTKSYINSYIAFSQLADKTIVFTNWAKELYVKNGVDENKLEVIDTGGMESITIMKENIVKKQECFELCYIGRCEKIKGIHILINAVKQIGKDYMVKVYFYGGSWEENEYGKELLKQIENDNRFVKPRFVNNPDLMDVISKHDACVIPSIWPETGPLTVFDAFGAGLPVIGSNSAGIKEKVTQDVDGLLFEVGNSFNLKELLERCIKSPVLLQNLKSNIKLNRTMREVAKEHLALFQKI